MIINSKICFIKITKMIFLVSSLFILFSCKDKVIFKKKEVVLIKAPISFYPNRTFPLELSEDKSLIQFKWKNNELYFVDKNQILFKKYFDKYQDAFVESKDFVPQLPALPPSRTRFVW